MISSSPEQAVDISDDNADFFPDAGIIPSEGSNCTKSPQLVPGTSQRPDQAFEMEQTMTQNKRQKN